jgi:hypothetical protein
LAYATGLRRHTPGGLAVGGVKSRAAHPAPRPG